MATIEQYLHNLYRVQPDFVYSVSRDFAKSCQTPMLVLPDDIVAHPLQVSIDIASLAPNADHGVSLEGAAGAEGPHHQPRAHIPEAGIRRRSEVEIRGSLRCAFQVGDQSMNGPFANA
jgi:hypothetical protein